MNQILLLLIGMITTLGCQKSPIPSSFDFTKSSHTSSLIYGDDDRELWRDAARNFKNLSPAAKATAAILLSTPPDRVYTLGEGLILCEGERFVNESTWSDCTGVLVGSKHLLTAGHCANHKNACANMQVYFDYTGSPQQASGPFFCNQIIKLENGHGQNGDYALIELDREITDRKPIKIAPQIEEKQSLWSLSHPMGLPLMLAQGDFLGLSINGYFKVAVDTFKGSSGSPLFNQQSELVGILSRGGDDIDEDELHEARRSGSCIRFRRCQTGTCFGETYYRVTPSIIIK